jgi:hypothetical protein
MRGFRSWSSVFTARYVLPTKRIYVFYVWYGRSLQKFVALVKGAAAMLLSLPIFLDSRVKFGTVYPQTVCCEKLVQTGARKSALFCWT